MNGGPTDGLPRVLLVDDEPPALTTLSALLSREYDVITAPNALAAMRELERIPVAAVVTDERMPGMSGTRFLAYVRRTHPATARIILTAYSDSDALLRAINEGEVERFLLKPVRPGELREALTALLDRHRAETCNRELTGELARRNLELEARVRELEETRERIDRAEGLALAGRLAAGVARDVRSYVGPAGGSVEDAVRRLDELSNDGVDLTGADRTRYALAPVRLDAWALDYVRTLDVEPALRARRVRVDACSEAWCMIDERRFGRLVSSLLQNAIDATRAGDAITVRVESGESGVCFEVIDTGVGLNPALRNRVFDPFFTTRPQHAGLGLHVCKLIAEGHGGAIDCESDPGRGTTMRVRLPRLER